MKINPTNHIIDLKSMFNHLSKSQQQEQMQTNSTTNYQQNLKYDKFKNKNKLKPCQVISTLNCVLFLICSFFQINETFDSNYCRSRSPRGRSPRRSRSRSRSTPRRSRSDSREVRR